MARDLLQRLNKGRLQDVERLIIRDRGLKRNDFRGGRSWTVTYSRPKQPPRTGPAPAGTGGFSPSEELILETQKLLNSDKFFVTFTFLDADIVGVEAK